METLRETQKKYCSQAISLAILSAFVFIIIERAAVGKGLILGTLFSIINFILIGESIPLRIGKSKRKTFFLSLCSIIFRYILMAIPLIVGLKFEEFNLISVIVGIFSIQIILIIDHLRKHIFKI